MSPAVTFVQELPAGRPNTPSEDIAAFARTLRRHPGQWAVYPWSDGLAPRTRINRASDINCDTQYAPAALRGGDFEAAVRAGVMYVRYVGGSR